MKYLVDYPATFSRTRAKYNARRVEVDGMTFDSQAEAVRYCQLRLMQEAGHISALVCHPRYCILDGFTYQGKRERAIFYEADFGYCEDGREVVEDVKGFRTALYLLKRKMLLSRYPHIDFREVDA